MRLWLCEPLLLLLLPIPVWSAQATIPNLRSPEQFVQMGAAMSQSAAQDLEAQLERNPEDLAARARLLGFYYYQWMKPGAAVAKASRRRHILWLIEHHPESPLTGVTEAAIDQTGENMADPEGYTQARKLWLALMNGGSASPPALGNLAKFFQIVDNDLAEKALLKALAMQPASWEWQQRLGYLYSMGILGIATLGLNGQPTSIDPYAADGPFAAKSRKALAESTSGAMLSTAASNLWRYGTILTPSAKHKLGYMDQAIQLMQRAKVVEPTNPNWTVVLTQMESYRRQIESAPVPGK